MITLVPLIFFQDHKRITGFFDSMVKLNAQEWGDFLSEHPEAHLLQTPEWGKLKARFGWQVEWILDKAEGAERTGAQILYRNLPFGISLAYIPKGPVGGSDQISLKDRWSDFWLEVDKICRKKRCIFLKVEPDLWLESIDKFQDSPHPNDTPASDFPVLPPGFKSGVQDVQPPRTSIVDLRASEEDILSRMKQKTRYNIRLAEKKGVIVRKWDDLQGFHHLMVETGQRDGFGVHSLDYYLMAYDSFHAKGQCELFGAFYGELALAGLMIFKRGGRCWYFYGASSGEHRKKMPSYLLQWEAMRWAKKAGCFEYDLWGIPDAEEAKLEADFTNRSDGLWGVYRFKRGFGGQIRRSPGPWDRVYQPSLYKLYHWWLGNRSSLQR